jgi:pimeloyl-[acyl-carrier protein] methyl ester esterase
MNNLALWCHQTGNLHADQQIVFLHGWGLHSDVWLPLLPFLEKNYQITLIDLPGHGRSQHCAWPDDIHELVHQLAEHIRDNAVVVGWSLGGLIAILLAQQTQNIKALITIACNPCFVCRDDWPCAMPPTVFAQFEDALTADAEQLLQQFAGLVCKEDAKARTINKTLKTLLFKHGKPDAQTLGKALIFLKNTDLRYLLSNSAQPALHLFGRNDVLVPVAVASQLRVLASAHQMIVTDEASHIPFCSQPEVVAKHIHAFISQMVS